MTIGYSLSAANMCKSFMVKGFRVIGLVWVRGYGREGEGDGAEHSLSIHVAVPLRALDPAHEAPAQRSLGHGPRTQHLKRCGTLSREGHRQAVRACVSSGDVHCSGNVLRAWP